MAHTKIHAPGSHSAVKAALRGRQGRDRGQVTACDVVKITEVSTRKL